MAGSLSPAVRPVRCEINGADLARKRDREIIKFAYDFLAFRNICDEHSSAWVGRKQRKRYQISRVEAVLCLSVRKIVQPLYFRSAWWCFRERNENIWNDPRPRALCVIVFNYGRRKEKGFHYSFSFFRGIREFRRDAKTRVVFQRFASPFGKILER